MTVGFSKILIASIACLSGLRADWRDMLSGQSHLQHWFLDTPLRDISWSMGSRGTSGLRAMFQNRLPVSYLVRSAFPKPARVGSPYLDGAARYAAIAPLSDGSGCRDVNGQSALQRFCPSPSPAPPLLLHGSPLLPYRPVLLRH